MTGLCGTERETARKRKRARRVDTGDARGARAAVPADSALRLRSQPVRGAVLGAGAPPTAPAWASKYSPGPDQFG